MAAQKNKRTAAGLLLIDANYNMPAIMRSKPYNNGTNITGCSIDPSEWSTIIQRNLRAVELFFSGTLSSENNYSFDRRRIEENCYAHIYSLAQNIFHGDNSTFRKRRCHISKSTWRCISDDESDMNDETTNMMCYVGPRHSDGRRLKKHNDESNSVVASHIIMNSKLFPEILQIPRGRQEPSDKSVLVTALREYHEETKCSNAKIFVYPESFSLEWDDGGITWTYELFVGFCHEPLTFESSSSKAFFRATLSGDGDIPPLPLFINVDSYKRVNRTETYAVLENANSINNNWRRREETLVPRSHSQEYSLLSNSISKRYNEIITIVHYHDYKQFILANIVKWYVRSNYFQFFCFVDNVIRLWRSTKHGTIANQSVKWLYVTTSWNKKSKRQSSTAPFIVVVA
ncbi:ADP-ribose pyrophasphatase [Olea europaea subsp. europaea]|uniref:ADP-ribose pyrophasphatase n=1 Tax=Olea europaea subsp. europaea TaxID=158383 RepID=A0A8S0TG03_OLEEU|nr:ADP-ribose pyrophasphatase [Olea europaea subsp. europaea]